MKLRRSLSVLAVFVMMNGSLLGSEPEKRLQVRWGELGKLIGGKKVALQLAEGARVEGRVRKVIRNSLVVKVKKSSDPVAYPKGKTKIPREAVSRIEARKSRILPARRIALTVGVFAGVVLASYVAMNYTESTPPGGLVAGGGLVVGGATVAAVLTYRALGPKGITLIEILTDLPVEGSAKPTDREQSSRPNQDTSALSKESFPVISDPLVLPAFKHNGIGAAVPSLIEQSRSERLRQQARRAVMRQGIPLHLSGLPERRPPFARPAED